MKGANDRKVSMETGRAAGEGKETPEKAPRGWHHILASASVVNSENSHLKLTVILSGNLFF